MCRSLSSRPQGAGGIDIPIGVVEPADWGGVDAFGETTIIIGVPASSRQMADIGGKSPIGDNISQLDSIPIIIFPIRRVLVVQIDEANPAVNLSQFALGL